MSETWDLFAEFCRQELATGGPDPQMAVMAYLSRNETPSERVWMAGCYGAHHCIPSGYAVWKEWRPAEVIAKRIDLEMWLEDHWACLPVRPEMRSHRMVMKRAECLECFAQFALNGGWDSPTVTYNEAWRWSIDKVAYYNRYMAIKFLEMLRLKVNPTLEIPDMRARGAWSPRIALGMLFPESNFILADKTKNAPEHVRLTEEYAALARDRLYDRGVKVSFFQLQVLLCEFREALVGGYYPGASLDEEMEFIRTVEGDFDMTDVWEARKALFPNHLLGELNGWRGVRKDMYRQFKGVATYERI